MPMSAKRNRPQSVVLERGIRRIWLETKTGWTPKIQVQLARGDTRRAQLFETYEEARACKKDWIERGIPVKGAPPIPPEDDTSATLDDALRARVKDLENRDKDAAVPERTRTFLRKSWPQGASMPLNLVTLDTLREYRQRREEGSKPNTIIRELRELRATLKQAIPGFKVPARVEAGIFPAENLTRVRTMDGATYDRVFARLRKQSGSVLTDMADLALLGVMRLSDVRLLQRTSVNLPAGLLELPTTKTGDPRAVVLCPKAKAIIRRALAQHVESPWVFPGPSGKPYSRVHVSRVWRKAARSAGLTDFSFHDLRHVLPTQAMNDGATPDVLKTMGGWKSYASVARYAQVMNPTVRKYLGPPK